MTGGTGGRRTVIVSQSSGVSKDHRKEKQGRGAGEGPHRERRHEGQAG